MNKWILKIMLVIDWFCVLFQEFKQRNGKILKKETKDKVRRFAPSYIVYCVHCTAKLLFLL